MGGGEGRAPPASYVKTKMSLCPLFELVTNMLKIDREAITTIVHVDDDDDDDGDSEDDDNDEDDETP